MNPHPDRRRLDTRWRLARLAGPSEEPAGANWFSAQVPGAVQLDWGRAKNLPDINFGQNVRLYAGLEDSFWLYRTQVPPAPRAKGERLVFVCGGVDFECEVRVNGATVLMQRGMQSAFACDVSSTPPGTNLDVLIFPAPKRHAEPADRSQASHVTKPAVSYGWDWAPRLIPLGIWQDTWFEIRPETSLHRVDFDYTLADDFSAADIRVSVETDPPGAAFVWRLRDSSGVVLESSEPRAPLRHPRLWWTHDHGEPHLYDFEVELSSGDRLWRRVGLRRVRLVMHAGAWEEEPAFPKSQHNSPITLELNGRRIFVKGSNWVPANLFAGADRAETYRPLLRLARDAHLNLLRCWGGGPAPKEPFFESCDELGLLVWQEFPLACNLYPDDPQYLGLLDRESRAMIARLRQHPSLGIWCGGNELFNSWSRMTNQSLPLRLLDRNCYDLDPLTPFMMTAPLNGMGHGDYRILADGREVFEIFQSARCTAYSEFGCPGISPVAYLKTFIPAEEFWPPRAGTSWETHHGFNAWEADLTTWLCTSTLEHYFGPFTSAEDMVSRSTWLQTESYKAVFEEARRQHPRCSMALNWCLNEPWPTAGNNSLINWPAHPKPAYAAVKAACRPVMASARIPKFQWRPGERFTAQLWLFNDEARTQGGGELRAVLVVGGQRTELARWPFPELPAQGMARGPDIGVELADATASEFSLELEVAPQSAWSSSYRLSLARRPTARVEDGPHHG